MGITLKDIANSKIQLMEQWKDITDYEGMYQVSDQGKVRGLNRTAIRGNKIIRVKGMQLAERPNDKGYLTVSLCKKGVRQNYYIHRLVAISFIPNPDHLPEVNHKNGNKKDNRVTELEWATTSANIQHAHDTGLNKGRKGVKNRADYVSGTEVKVAYYDKYGNYIKTFESQGQAARELGIKQSCISQSIHSNVTKPRKYIFKAVE